MAGKWVGEMVGMMALMLVERWVASLGGKWGSGSVPMMAVASGSAMVERTAASSAERKVEKMAGEKDVRLVVWKVA